MRYTNLASVVAVLVVLACPVQAHHSFAMFDKTRLTTVKGMVSKIEWTNPHVFIFVDVPDGKGGKTQYAVECNSPNVLMRAGWKVSTVKRGDAVAVGLYPLRDGRPGGLLDSVTLPTGKTIKG
ncbi:MAG: DUF6152 family protein [Gammaproteobacteria bacterium]